MKETRNTKQFETIRSIITNAGRPLSIDEMQKSALEELDSIGLRTVYRAVRRMEEMDEIQSIKVQGRADRYELSCIASSHHHHFHCTACDRLFDIHGCPGGLSDLLPKGFQMANHDILLTGTCDTC